MAKAGMSGWRITGAILFTLVAALRRRSLSVGSRALAALMVLIWLVASALAQTVPGTEDIGLPNGAAYDGDKFENVQLNTGNLHIEIPLWSNGGRGIPMGAKLVFDSKGYSFYTLCTAVRDGKVCQNWLRRNGGWRIIGPISYGIGQERIETRNCGGDTASPHFGNIYGNFFISEPDGTRHPVPGFVSDVALCAPTRKILYAGDNSGWMLDADELHGFKAYRKDGFKIDKSGQGPFLEDTNGNELSYNYSQATPPVLSFVDTLGITHQADGSYYDANGTLQQIQITYQNVPMDITSLLKLCNCVGNGVFTTKVPQSVVFPNGATYTIDYGQNTDGNPASITVPDGGKISWTYQDGDVGGKMVATRTVTVSGQSSTWTYTPGSLRALSYNGSNWISKVSDPNSNDTTIACGNNTASNTGEACHITQQQYFSGSSSGGVVLKTETTDYMPLIQGPYTSFLWNFPSAHTTTWNQTNQVTRTETDWDINLEQVGITNYGTGRGIPLEIREFDYGTGAPGPLLKRTHYAYLHSPTAAYDNTVYDNLGIHDRRRDVIVYDGNNNMVSYTSYEYDNYSHQGLPGMGTSGAVQHDPNRSTGYLTRGNRTGVYQWRNTDGAWLTTFSQYDDTGNIIAVQDPNGNQTSFSYADSWGNASCAPSGGNAAAYPTSVSNALGQVARKTYNSCTGSTATATDLNNQTTTFAYNDSMTRLTSVLGPPDPNNGNQQAQTTYDYSDSPNWTYTHKKVQINSSTPPAEEYTLLDGLGRVIRHATSSGEGNPWNEVDMCYDGLGHKQYETYPYQGPGWVSSSYRCPGNPPYYPQFGNSFAYDALGRLTTTTHADGGIARIDSSQFPKITTTDEAQHARQSQTDALGRLVKVWETDPATGVGFPNETDYQYDTLGNLTLVQQQGGVSDPSQWRTRTFSYDSLSRLLSATNPESGTINYGYDASGNLASKTSPAPNQTGAASLQTSFYYDVLNRLTEKCFSDGTPCESLYYDYPSVWGLTIHNPIGRLVATGVSSNNANTLTSYDVMGRPEWQTELRLGAPLKTFNYAYNLDSSLKSIAYPSGRSVTYTYNQAQKPTSAIGNDGTNFATGAHYTAWGALLMVVNGNITTTNYFNIRQQPCRIAVSGAGIRPFGCDDQSSVDVLDLSYDFSLGQYDNGNIYGVANNKDNSRSQQLGYDALNRLLWGYTSNLNSGGYHNWWQGFSYDNWGNLLTKNVAGGDTSLSVGVNGNNQVTAWCYDAAGNIVGANVCPSFTNIYDGENRLTQTGAGATSYGYDAVGQRVKKSNGGTGTLYWQGAGGEVLEETDLNGNFQHDYVFFGGKRIAGVFTVPPSPPPPPNGGGCNPAQCPPPPSGSSSSMAISDGRFGGGTITGGSPVIYYYYFSDHLGSANVVTDAIGNIKEESDFYPFGGERVVTDLGIGNNYKFTGKERDPETGCDYFGARYYCNSIGRFLTPDWAAKPVTVPYAKFGDPQSLNLYSYVENGPVNRVDADGHYGFPALDSMSMRIPGPDSSCQTLGQNCDNWADRNTRPYIGAGPVGGPRACVGDVAAWCGRAQHKYIDQSDGEPRGTVTSGSMGSYGPGSPVAEIRTTFKNGVYVQTVLTYANSDDSPVTTVTLTYGDALDTFGANALGEARDGSTPNADEGEDFNHQVAEDIKHHPYGTAGVVIRSAGLPVGVACVPCGIGMLIGGEILATIDSAKDATPYK